MGRISKLRRDVISTRRAWRRMLPTDVIRFVPDLLALDAFEGVWPGLSLINDSSGS